MLIGHKGLVAVELALDEDYGEHMMFGKFCYWVGSTHYGDYDLGSSLGDVLTCLTRVIKDNGNRKHDEFGELCSQGHFRTVFNMLNTALYEYDDYFDARALDEQWARFEISLQVDIFYDYQIYLIEGGESSYILACKISDQRFAHHSVPRHVFEAVTAIAYEVMSIISELIVNRGTHVEQQQRVAIFNKSLDRLRDLIETYNKRILLSDNSLAVRRENLENHLLTDEEMRLYFSKYI